MEAELDTNAVHQADSKNPYFFLVGCLRSGTTLLRRVLDVHPDVAVIHESQWVPRFYEKQRGVDEEGRVTSGIIDLLFGRDRTANLGLGRAELEALVESRPPFFSFVSSVFDLYGSRRGKSLVGEKSPGYVRHLDTLRTLFPKAKIVHLVRDGRDVCMSVRAWEKSHRNIGKFSTWASDPVSTAGVWWSWHVELGREGREVLGPDLYYELRYESLVADPETELRNLCAYLDVPFSDTVIRHHEHLPADEPESIAKKRWRPITPGLRNWRTDMSRQDIELFEAAAGESLEMMGYERAVVQPGQEALDSARRVQSAVKERIVAKRDSLPTKWHSEAFS